MFSWFLGCSVSALDYRGHTETHGSYFFLVNGFGDDEELSTSSGSDEDVIKQFEISVSRSQSFLAGASEQGKPSILGQKPKRTRPLSTQKEDSTEVSAGEGIPCITFSLYLD